MQLGVVVLDGTTNADHMRDDLTALDFALDDVEVRAIDALLGTPEAP